MWTNIGHFVYILIVQSQKSYMHESTIQRFTSVSRFATVVTYYRLKIRSEISHQSRQDVDVRRFIPDEHHEVTQV